jgi:hypothetical protein
MKTSIKLPLFVLAMASLAPVAFTGCQATTTAVSNVRGEVKTMYSTDMESVFQAASKAIAELKFTKLLEKHDAITGLLTSTTADNTKIEIRLRMEGERVVGVSIRVGAFGDERIAQAINAKIKESL